MLNGPRKSPVGGFSLLELVAVLAVIGALAAVLVPAVLGRLTSGQTAALARDLSVLSQAALSFRGDVGRYPADLRNLATAPTVTSRDTCNRLMPSGAATRWKGPYIGREIPATGIPSGPNTIRITVRRLPATYSPTGTMFFDVDGVEVAVANELERSIDGNADLTGGTIRWTAVGGDVLSYAIPISDC